MIESKPQQVQAACEQLLAAVTAMATRVDNLTQALQALADKVRHQEEEIRFLKPGCAATNEAEPDTRLAG